MDTDEHGWEMKPNSTRIARMVANEKGSLPQIRGDSRDSRQPLFFIRTTTPQIFVFLAKNWPQENTRNTKKRSCVSAFYAFFCGSHLWLRRQPRQVHLWL